MLSFVGRDLYISVCTIVLRLWLGTLFPGWKKSFAANLLAAFSLPTKCSQQTARFLLQIIPTF